MNVLNKIPRGWRLVAVGERVTRNDKVCMHPFKEWVFMGPASGLAYPAKDNRVQASGDWYPYGYYITKRKKK